jgi:hypothetical protein
MEMETLEFCLPVLTPAQAREKIVRQMIATISGTATLVLPEPYLQQAPLRGK